MSENGRLPGAGSAAPSVTPPASAPLTQQELRYLQHALNEDINKIATLYATRAPRDVIMALVDCLAPRRALAARLEQLIEGVNGAPGWADTVPRTGQVGPRQAGRP